MKKIAKGIPRDTGYPIDGKISYWATWAYDDESCWHLRGWDDKVDEAFAKTFWQTDQVYSGYSFEEFYEMYKDGRYDHEGAFVIELDQLEVIGQYEMGDDE